MGVAVSRRGWWAGWCLAGSVVLGAAWWGQHDDLTGAHPLPAALAGKETPAVQSMVARLPLAFEPNHGQSDSRVLFLSRNPGYSLYLTAQGAVLGLNGIARPLSFTWQGAGAKPQAEGVAALSAKHNYLRGDDPRHWQRAIPTYEKVRYRNLYPGIDLIYYGRQRHLEYDLVVAPGADPAAIRLRVAGMDGLRVDDGGALRLQVADRTLTLSKPVIYQETAGGRQAVKGGYVRLADNQVGLQLASYDRSKPLIIDPVLNYSTFLGGSGFDQGKGVAVDGAGNIYVVGQAASGDFPVMGALQNSNAGGGSDVFVAKFNPAGTMLFATYLGGSGDDRGFAVAVDDTALYIVGDTTSADFPTQNADQPAAAGDIDAFVAKMTKDGSSLMYSTYLGGSRSEEGLGIAVDASGNAYVAGATLSFNFPTTTGNAFNLGSSGDNCDDPSHPGTAIPCSDAYVAKYSPSGVKHYARFVGGYFEDAATAIAVNSAAEAYITGITNSTDLPVGSNGFQQKHAGGVGDAFILRLDATGGVDYGTYLGGEGWDQGQAIAVDGSGNVYVAGATNSGSNVTTTTLPITRAAQQLYGGGIYDAFVAKVNPGNPASSQLQYLTYLGGADKDYAFGIAADGSGNAYVVGETMSTNFPVDTALQSTWFGAGKQRWGDGFITKIDTAGYLLNWSTYLGGSDDDWANGVALEGNGGIVAVGSSFSADFATENPSQGVNAGNGDAMLFKLADSSLTVDLQLGVSAAPDPVGSGETLTYEMTVNNLSAGNDAGGVVIAATLPGGISFKSATPAGACSASGAQVTCTLGTIAAGGSATASLETVSDAAGNITFTAGVVRANQPDPDASNNSASVTTIAAVGSSGGGAWSLWEFSVIAIIYLLRRQVGIAGRPA